MVTITRALRGLYIVYSSTVTVRYNRTKDSTVQYSIEIELWPRCSGVGCIGLCAACNAGHVLASAGMIASDWLIAGSWHIYRPAPFGQFNVGRASQKR